MKCQLGFKHTHASLLYISKLILSSSPLAYLAVCLFVCFYPTTTDKWLAARAETAADVYCVFLTNTNI